MKTNYKPGQILYIQSTDNYLENYFYISIMRSMQQHPVVDDDNRYEINTCCDLCVDVYWGEMYPASITFARGGNASTWDVDIEFDEVRPAHDFEKKLLFDRLVYEYKLHDPKWMHLTDSTYLDILDWLEWAFDVDLDDEASQYTPIGETISEIQKYIWDAICKETGNYQEKTTESEIVNKAELIDKAINYFTPILKTYCSKECVKELIDGFVNSMKE